MKKREYISPIAEIVEVGIFNIMLGKSDEQTDDKEQMSNEYRGDSDWSNIWEGM